MAVQQIAGFRVNPGHRDELFALLKQVQANTVAAGARARVGVVTSGPNAGAVVTSTEHADWEAFAAFSDAAESGAPTQPMLDAMRSGSPPATLIGTGIRNELMARDGAVEEKSFLSSISFDVVSDRPEVTAAVGEMRDLFDSCGSVSRIFATANGDNAGRITIAGEYDGIGGWARFRQRLEDATAQRGAPMNAVAGKFVGAGIVQVRALEL